jgi:L-fuculose-phosphate aldolase
MKKMLLEKERAEIVEFGRKLVKSRLTTGTGGNLSLADRGKNLVAITPSGIDYDEMAPEDVVVLDFDGETVAGVFSPSSEKGFHLGLYRKRGDVNAVIHTHSHYATTLACLKMEIPAVHYLVGFCGKKVPVAEYATYGTEELAGNVCAAIEEYNAVLMANHGLVAVGPDLLRAFSVAEEIEFVARIYYQALSIGKPVVLPDREMERVIEKFSGYGQKKKA